MFTLQFFYIVFFVLVFFILVKDRYAGLDTFILVFITIMFICIAGLRPAGLDKDYYIYEYYLKLILNDPTNDLIAKEPAFRIITGINARYFSNQMTSLLLFFACISVSLKIYSIRQLSTFPLMSILIYFSFYFIIHDMTQIRAAVASGLFLLSIPDIIEKRPVNYYIKIFLAISFHFSAAVLLPFYFLTTQNFKVRNYFLLILSGILISVFRINIEWIVILIIKPFPLLYQKYLVYINLFSQGHYTMINLWNLYYISMLFIFSIICLIYKEWKEDTLLKVLMKIWAIGIFSFYALWFLPALSFRISELLNIVNIIILVNISLYFRPSAIIKWLILIYSFFMFYNTIVIQKIINIAG